MCSVYQVVSILIINDIIVAVKTRKYFQSLKNLCPERWSSLSPLFVKLHLNMSKVIGKILSVYQKPLTWKVVSLIWKSAIFPNMTFICEYCGTNFSQKKTLTRHIKSKHDVNSQQLAKISLELILTQSIIRSDFTNPWSFFKLF